MKVFDFDKKVSLVVAETPNKDILVSINWLNLYYEEGVLKEETYSEDLTVEQSRAITGQFTKDPTTWDYTIEDKLKIQELTAEFKIRNEVVVLLADKNALPMVEKHVKMYFTK